ncbi:MAG: peptide chain release factor N(5)-glutamine methyltransferase [Flavobacteriaceae bacterium]|nr:peptide chain release factor N(5)-glutamine methyltransferase [Flavobacteriaceae bacterium]
MFLLDLKKEFQESLEGIYPSSEVEGFLGVLLDAWLSMRRYDLVFRPEIEIDQEMVEKFRDAMKALQGFVPIQYIVGQAPFYQETFFVNSSVLIPRPETEELVDWILQEATVAQKYILDVGTGSGCIAISLAQALAGADVWAIDKSIDALEVAKRNDRNLGTSVQFSQIDILEHKGDFLEEKMDVVVSNPPYVRVSEKSQMRENVLGKEPDMALFVEDKDPLIFYRFIAQKAKKYWLRDEGWLYFEINQYLGEQMVVLMEDLGYGAIQLKKDIFGNDRMLRAQWKLGNT